MSTVYRRKATPVDAWTYTGQPQADWPAWVQEHRVPTNMGLIPIGLGAGVLLLPTKGGTTINVQSGQTLVLEDGVVTAYKAEKFEQFFESVTSEPAPTVEPSLAPEPPAEKVKAKKDEPAPAAEEPPVVEEPPAATDEA